MKVPPLFAGVDLRDQLARVAVRGFTLRWKIVPRMVCGGTWVAQVSRRGRYVRAQHKDPGRAVALLAERIVKADRETDGAGWRRWRRRPWRFDE